MMELCEEDMQLDDETDRLPPRVEQTRALGSKQSAVRWLPQDGSNEAVACAGTWEESQNMLTLWAFDAREYADDGDEHYEHEIGLRHRKLCSAPHDGCVLGMSIGQNKSNARVVYTASGAGGVSCYRVSSSTTLSLLWKSQAQQEFATLGVSWNEQAGALAAANEDGSLVLYNANGEHTASATCQETELFGLCWQSPSTLLTASSAVLVWDRRAGLSAPVRKLEPVLEAAAHLAPQLHCVSAHPQHQHLVAAGASDGALYLWDDRLLRAPAVCLPASGRERAHGADVWGLQLCDANNYGDLLSCSSDGTLQAWTLPRILVDNAQGVPSREQRTLVQLHMPINSLDYSADLGMLIAASDAEMLTCIDMR